MSYHDTIATARSIHGRYPLRPQNIFLFLLEAFCLPLEVFLHRRFGCQYFHLPKAFVGLLFPFLCMVMINIGVSFKISISPFNIGLIRAYPIIHLPESWAMFWQNFVDAYKTFTNLLQLTDKPSADAILAAIVLYILAANLRWAGQITRDIYRITIHPRSSGEPAQIWNFFYWLGQKLNSRSDIVKQFCEPLFCIGIAQILLFLRHYGGVTEAAAQTLQFMSVWLGFGGMLLMLKAFIENRNRNAAEFDRLANEVDSEAYEANAKLDEEDDTINITPQPKI